MYIYMYVYIYDIYICISDVHLNTSDWKSSCKPSDFSGGAVALRPSRSIGKTGQEQADGAFKASKAVHGWFMWSTPHSGGIFHFISYRLIDPLKY